MAAPGNTTYSGDNAYRMFSNTFMLAGLDAVAQQFPQEGMLEFEHEDNPDNAQFKVTYSQGPEGTATHSDPTWAGIAETTIKVAEVVKGRLNYDTKTVEFEGDSVQAEFKQKISFVSISIEGTLAKVQAFVDGTLQVTGKKGLISIKAPLTDADITGTTIEWASQQHPGASVKSASKR